MNWLRYHKESEHLASDAHLAFKQGFELDAQELFLSAAVIEMLAIGELDKSKKRTLGILVVSSVSLFAKANQPTLVNSYGSDFLETENLPTFAIAEVRELIKNFS